jgi:hypothetical protein
MNSNNEMKIVKISFDTNVKNAIDYIIDLFENKHIESVKIIGLSQAITKVILIVEVIKARIQNLHQTNQIDSIVARDKYDSNQTKNVPRVDILLSTKEPDEKGNGYQIPLNEIEFKKLCEIKSNILENEEENNSEIYDSDL